MNSRQRRHARRHPEPRETYGDHLIAADLLFNDSLNNRVARTMAQAREVKRIPKWKRLAMLLGFSSALLGCAAKKSARASLVIPFDCLREVQVADTLCNGTASPETFDCNHVQVKAECVRAKAVR